MANLTRIFFVADLHGSAVCWRKFINAAKVYRANVLLVGGDIAAKTMTPVFEERGKWTSTIDGHPREAASLTELERLESSLRDASTVPFRTSPGEWKELLAKPGALDAVFERLSVEELGRWLEWARGRIGDESVRLLIGLGNDDFTPMEEAILADPFAELTDLEVVRLEDGHEVLTLPYSNPTPWKTHRELTEEEIGSRIEAIAATLDHPESAVYNIHVPPFNTPLDLAPRLDSLLTKVMTPGGHEEMIHVGSTAVRAALERHHPLIGLHGHIHESRGTSKFGRTLSVNCGSAYTEGVLLGALIDLAGDQVRSSILTTG
ncbi:MAG: metallophosphoesterase [Thermoplasmata archaeon]